MASRKELVEYDRTKQMTKSPDTEPSTPVITTGTTSATSLTLPYGDVQVSSVLLCYVPMSNLCENCIHRNILGCVIITGTH